MSILYQLGFLTIQQFPFNTEEVVRETSGDYAVKEIVGAMKPREFMGEGDETFTLSGNIFPHFMARNSDASGVITTGLEELDTLNGMRQTGEPYLLMRGDGLMMGFFFIDKVVEKGQKLDANGVARIVRVDIHLVRSPRPPGLFAAINTLISVVGLAATAAGTFFASNGPTTNNTFGPQ